MNPLVSSTVTGIAENAEAAFHAAAEIVQAYIALDSELDEPYRTAFKDVPPTHEDISAIKHALLSYLEREPRPEHAVVTYFVLGKVADSSLVPVLQSHLAMQLSTLIESSAALGNLICALDNIREPILNGEGFNATNVEINIKNARLYLHERGITVR
jgi:hypothetical protein